jgi:hypothetical protein
MEPQTHRLRPEGLSLNATFGGTVNNAGQNLVLPHSSCGTLERENSFKPAGVT